MPNINYVNLPDTRLLKAVEIQGMLDELDNGYNTVKFSDNDLEPQAIRFRNLKNAPRYPLRHVAGTIPTVLGSVWVAGGWNFHPIWDTVLKFNLPHASLANRLGTGYPVFNTKARLRRYDTDVQLVGTPWRVTIGYSLDAGATWIPIVGAVRTSYNTCGNVPPYFDFSGQSHYITGAAWYPPTEHFDRGVVVEASFGGDTMQAKDATSAGSIWACVMIDYFTDIMPRFEVIHEANARAVID